MKESTSTQKKDIRKQFRALRNKLTTAQQLEAAVSLVERFKSLLQETQPNNIAVFLPNDGELSPQKVIEDCWQLGVNTYLPVIDPENPGHLLFYQYTFNTPLVINQYGIPEPNPKTSTHIDYLSLDWVLMPLVAFTEQGQRLGMGGGYYDRTFKALVTDNAAHTRLIGIAHECQRAERLPVDSWDIDLHGIMTPDRYIQL